MSRAGGGAPGRVLFAMPMHLYLAGWLACAARGAATNGLGAGCDLARTTVSATWDAKTTPVHIVERLAGVGFDFLRLSALRARRIGHAPNCVSVCRQLQIYTNGKTEHQTRAATRSTPNPHPYPQISQKRGQLAGPKSSFNKLLFWNTALLDGVLRDLVRDEKITERNRTSAENIPRTFPRTRRRRGNYERERALDKRQDPTYSDPCRYPVPNSESPPTKLAETKEIIFQRTPQTPTWSPSPSPDDCHHRRKKTNPT